MKRFFSNKIITYSAIMLGVLIIAGSVLSPFVTNSYILLAILIFIFLMTLILIIYTFETYIKPLNKVSETMDKLLEGNYHARISGTPKGAVRELSEKINQLARNLSELTIQEQIQAKQLSTVIENSESGLVLIDEKGYIHLVNRKFISMFGKSTKDYIGYLYYDVLENEQIHHTVQKIFLQEEHVKELFSSKSSTELPNYYEIVGAPIFNERNLLKGAVLVIYDITEFKQLEVMRKDFVANVSHELKTPITSIRGFAETLLDGAHKDEDAREHFLQIIFKESKRIQLLIDDLLILSKIEKDEPKLTIETFYVAQLMEELLPLFTQRAEQGAITLHMSIDETAQLEADKDKVKQILLNVFMNAINYTPAGGKVYITVKENADDVLLEIEDTGIGIEKEALPRIFERFYRVDKDRSRETGGTGLGLAIVKHIVEAHRGKIDVKSEIGEGSIFSIYLPKQARVMPSKR
ncbi:MAG TPA: ATP-binding protein [Pseudogracilibacillus sp.]|nr:ATP-binding protein [Pseudogracilibacillus sp.]